MLQPAVLLEKPARTCVVAIAVCASLLTLPMPLHAEGIWSGDYVSSNSTHWYYTLRVNGDRVSVRVYGEQPDGKRVPIDCNEGRLFPDLTFQATCHLVGSKTLFGLSARLKGSSTTMSYNAGGDQQARVPLTLQTPATLQPTTPAPAASPPTATSLPPSQPQAVTRTPTKEEQEKATLVQAMLPQLVQIQQALKDKGTYAGPTDGIWGPATETAIKSWQAREGKPQTGVLAAAEVDQVRKAGLAINVGPSATTAQPNGISRTVAVSNAANRFLLDGDPSDVVALINSHKDAPHADINLKNEPVFKSNTSDICFIGTDKLPIDIDIDVQEMLAQRGASIQNSLGRSCDVSGSDQWDIAIGRRRDFLTLPKGQWERLDKGLQDSTRKELFILQESEIKADRDLRSATRLSNEARIMNDGTNGWGFLLPESDTSTVCVISPSGDQAFAELVNANAKALQKDLGRRASFKSVLMDADTAFRAARRGQCGVTLAKQADLKAIISTLNQNKMIFKVASPWLAEDAVDGVLATAEAQKSNETAAAAETRRNAEAERVMRRQREEAEGLRGREATAALRRENGPKVAALVATLKDATADSLQMLPSALAQSKSKWFPGLFPSFAKWMEEQRKEGWESYKQDVVPVEFGLGQWGTPKRSLELILVQTNVTLRNPPTGSYAEHCFYNAYLNDPEFNRVREPFFIPCEKGGTVVSDYLKGLEFRSQWNAK